MNAVYNWVILQRIIN